MATRLASKAWLSALLLAILAAALYSINLGRLPHPDEFYHLLAAEGLNATGEPSIGEDGRYWRGYPFTWLVAQSIGAFGTSLAAGRLPAVLFAVALVVLLFLLLRRETGPCAAWIGGVLFAVSPFVVDIAQFTRFYSLQCLTFLGGAWLVYGVARAQWRWRRHVPLAGLAAALLIFSTYLQPTSLLGIVGLGAWLGVVVFVRLRRSTLPRPRQNLLIAGAFALGLVVLTGMVASGLLGALWSDFRSAQLFNEDRADEPWFYFLVYFLLYPTLWTTIGLLTVLAMRRNLELTLFLATVFIVGFALNSLAGAKNTRYIAYAQPFLFGLWGLGLASLLELGHEAMRRFLDELRQSLGGALHRYSRPAAGGLVALAVFSVVLANPAWLRSATLLADVTLPTQPPPTDWMAAKPTLQPWLDSADVLVTTEELGPLFYYGRADIMLSATKYYELAEERRRPFAPDHRTDVPVIATAEDLGRVMDCHTTGLFLTRDKHWGEGALRLRDEAVEALIEARAEPVEVPARSRILAFRWENGAPADPAECALVP
jgi:hypothetical protein